ncbi:MAG: hypothetical protein GY847_29245 [Proteobacteria bacterium]|nr:hypothetical protein [Pseudomonadota bacterium]
MKIISKLLCFLTQAVQNMLLVSIFVTIQILGCKQAPPLVPYDGDSSSDDSTGTDTGIDGTDTNTDIDTDTDNGTLIWAKRTGGHDMDFARSITALSDGSFYISGEFLTSAIFGEGETNQTELTSGGERDIFIAKYFPDGSLEWVKRAGGIDGIGVDFAKSIAAFSDGSIYVVGDFRRTVVFGSGEDKEPVLIAAGETDLYLAKYNEYGTLEWVRGSGGNYWDHGNGVVALSDKSALVTGSYQGSITFGKGEENETTLSRGEDQENPDVFIAKYNHNGDLLWARKAGGNRMDNGSSIVTLPDGAALITGTFFGNITFGQNEANQTELSSPGSVAVFIAEYDSDGNFIWAKQATGRWDPFIRMTPHTDGSFVMTGTFYNTATFGPGEKNETVLSSTRRWHAFIAKYNPDGNLIWAKSVGGTGVNYGRDITSLSDGSILVTGKFKKKIVFRPEKVNEIEIVSNGDFDVFIAKYNPDGILMWVKTAGGVGIDHCKSITTLSDGSALITGYFMGDTEFGQGEANETLLSSSGKNDIFIAKYAP